MYRIITATTAAALLLSACAQSAGSIPPVSMGAAYDGLDCKRAFAERQAAANALAALTSQQQQAVAGDAVGVLLIGVPMSSLMGGDKGGQIGLEKGRLMALDARLFELQRVMLTLHEHRFSDRTAFWVMNGPRRALAKARPIASGGYLLAAEGMCWMDPRAREVNRVTRSVDARYLWVKTAREAKRLLSQLVAQEVRQ